MALTPASTCSLLTSHHRCCLAVASWQTRRGYRPEKRIEIRKESLERRKSLSRKVYDKLGFHPPYITKSTYENKAYDRLHPKYSVPIIPLEENPHYHQKEAFIFNHRVRLQEGPQQTLWLTKSVLMKEKMPEALQEAANSLEIPDMEKRVTDAIKQCRQFDTEERVIRRPRYSLTQTWCLLRLSTLLGQPQFLDRTTTQEHYVSAAWDREDVHIQVRGRSGLLVSSKTPLPPVASRTEIDKTTSEDLPTFHPIAPTIDLQTLNVYKDNHNFPGFFDHHPYPHAHTRFIFNNKKWRWKYVVSKIIMFTFADAFARAKNIHGLENKSDLETPVIAQGIATDGVQFTFVTVQINTFNMQPNDGVKNMIWVDSENFLYEDMYPQDIVKRSGGNVRNNFYWVRKMVTQRDPEVGCQNLDLGVFKKFLAYMANH